VLDAAQLDALHRAKEILERPSLAIRIADRVGAPIDGLLRRLPTAAQEAIATATRQALEKSLDVALRTLEPAHLAARPPSEQRRSDWLHRGAVMASGALGGAFGLSALAVELPISLTVMLRSIAEHALAQGEDLSRLGVRLECLAVFAYGSRSHADDAADSAYFAVRAALSRAVGQAVEYVAERGALEAAGRSAPALAQLVARVAQRLGVAVTDKAAAQLLPVVGAAGGATVNALFLQHYQDTAWAHFTIRRLERDHGSEAVRSAYDAFLLPPAP
jgi:EcsC protein family